MRQRIERDAADAVAEFGSVVRLQADAAGEIGRVFGRRRRLPDGPASMKPRKKARVRQIE
jgi:hypothetical protein